MKKRDLRDLFRSIDEARKIHNGKAEPARVFKFNPITVKNIRRKLKRSQAEFAGMIGVSVDTLQNWEQGRRRPDGPALILLKVVEFSPETVIKALHV
jgi:putative transcriptional regulator